MDAQRYTVHHDENFAAVCAVVECRISGGGSPPLSFFCFFKYSCLKCLLPFFSLRIGAWRDVLAKGLVFPKALLRGGGPFVDGERLGSSAGGFALNLTEARCSHDGGDGCELMV